MSFVRNKKSIQKSDRDLMEEIKEKGGRSEILFCKSETTAKEGNGITKISTDSIVDEENKQGQQTNEQQFILV